MKKYLFLFLIVSFEFVVAQSSAIVIGDYLNGRECASTSCDILFQIRKNVICDILFKDKAESTNGLGINNWYKISVQGYEGYVYGAYIDILPDNPATVVDQKNAVSTGIVLADKVNIRDCAGLNCSKIAEVNNKTTLQIIGRSDLYTISGLGNHPWYEVQYNGKSGYIYGAFIDCSDCYFDDNDNNNTKGTVIGDNVNVRECSNLYCDVTYQLNLGDVCEVINVYQKPNEKHPWYEVNYNGTLGYINGQFLSIPTSTSHIKVWAIIVGIADYSPFMNAIGAADLNYSDSDAKKVYQFLKSPEGGSIPDQQIILIRNDEAIRDNIKTSIDTLFSKASSKDLIILYFSGHGGPNYLVAYDMPLRYSDVRVMMEKSKAEKRLCIADACYSGTWSSEGVASMNQKNLSPPQLEQLYYNALASSGNGIALFTSSRRNETSIELPALQQGLFTHFFIEGLSGKADGDNNRIVTITELYDYVNKTVSSAAWNNFLHEQNPTLSGTFDNQMPIGVVR